MDLCVFFSQWATGKSSSTCNRSGLVARGKIELGLPSIGRVHIGCYLRSSGLARWHGAVGSIRGSERARGG